MKLKKVTKQQGFTMLELMVVIVILGILASMVVPNVLGNKEIAMKQKAVSDITALETSLKMYKLHNNFYPTTDQGLEALVTQTDIEPLPRTFPEEGYLPRLPKDPWNNEYLLLNPGEFGAMDVFSAGPDGEAGTDDDIGNWNLSDFQ